jgi:hypothetical protein
MAADPLDLNDEPKALMNRGPDSMLAVLLQTP